jgi:hypothetical protein
VTNETRHPPGALLTETASLFYLLGGMAAKHLVIVGGMVPPLLVPNAADAHVGSADIDVCLSLAITHGATAQYYGAEYRGWWPARRRHARPRRRGRGRECWECT